MCKGPAAPWGVLAQVGPNTHMASDDFSDRKHGGSRVHGPHFPTLRGQALGPSVTAHRTRDTQGSSLVPKMSLAGRM